jgi:RNA polymerase sigma-54 factor
MALDMRFDYSQHMRLGQTMKLAPRVIQSMEILQMSLADLEERIEQELENNAVLELAEGDPEGPTVVADGLSEGLAEGEGKGVEAEQFERLESFEQDNPDAADNEYTDSGSEHETDQRTRSIDDFEYQPSRVNDGGDRDAKMDAMAATPARTASLHDQLVDQWSLVEVEASLKPLGGLILAFLDDDGYLRTPLETIADRAPLGLVASDPQRKPTVEELLRALTALQLFLDPPGVAARDARECLLLQLDAMEGDDDAEPMSEAQYEILSAARRIVDQHLDDLMQNRLPRIGEKTGLSMERIKEGLVLLRRLSLSPARRLIDESEPPITPDAIVEYDAETDRYVAFLNDSRVPRLRVNPSYEQMAKDRSVEKKDREFLRTNLNNAYWLIDAVNQRKRTLLRVLSVVVEAQREVFDVGMEALRPLPMTLVAEQLGIHVATVSRAVADKYIQTPRGVMALRKFFSGGTTNEAGEDVAWDAIKAALKDIIDHEDKAKPYSDEQLVEELKKRGLEIARRTVAKYRDQLKVPSARLRKTF